MARMKTVLVSALVLALGVGCGAPKQKGGGAVKPPENPSGLKDKKGAAVSQGAKEAFDAAMEDFQAADKSGKWQENCEAVANGFLTAAKQQKSDTNARFAEAIYNAGLAYQRCNRDADAKKLFEEVVEADSNFHRARAQLVLFEYQKSSDVDGTISRLDTIIRDAKFQNVEALVYLAALQMERGSDQADQDGADDYERAKKNIQRALAIDDGFMPAFNQLAIYYMEEAKRKAEKGKTSAWSRGRRRLEVAGAAKAQVNQQQLDLAALVASQGIRKNPNYAPIHNTAGLIQVELKNYNGAVSSFAVARRLDPKFFEAHMNYGAVNLSFRNFQEAEKAYRDAIKLKANEFEAHLGLALAIRGQIQPGQADKITEAQKHLDKCKEIDAKRPEIYYNEAILTQEYKAKGEEKSAIPMLKKAASLYKDFIAKAGSEPAFEEAVKRSKDRAQDIEDTVRFIEEGEKARKDQDAANAAAAAAKKAEDAKKAEEAKKAAEDAKKADAAKKAEEAKGPAAAKDAAPKDAKPAAASTGTKK
ncbi:MAG: hypothetical protein JW751_09080 [Polyangiaceae bacterium]|nr:hypothetical protein [Polyangiaceae bacterium]